MTALREIVHGEFGDRDSAFLGEASVGVMPIYSVTAGAIESGDLHGAWRTGWRYIWHHPDLPRGVTVGIRQRPGSRPKFLSYSAGKGSVRLVEALHRACRKLDGSPIRYRPRLLRVAALQVEALWFAADAPEPDCIFGLSHALTGTRFFAKARESAARLRDSAESGREGGPERQGA